jgi:hypothetical protein
MVWMQVNRNKEECWWYDTGTGGGKPLPITTLYRTNITLDQSPYKAQVTLHDKGTSTTHKQFSSKLTDLIFYFCAWAGGQSSWPEEGTWPMFCIIVIVIVARVTLLGRSFYIFFHVSFEIWNSAFCLISWSRLLFHFPPLSSLFTFLKDHKKKYIGDQTSFLFFLSLSFIYFPTLYTPIWRIVITLPHSLPLPSIICHESLPFIQLYRPNQKGRHHDLNHPPLINLILDSLYRSPARAHYEERLPPKNNDQDHTTIPQSPPPPPPPLLRHSLKIKTWTRWVAAQVMKMKSSIWMYRPPNSTTTR